MSERTLETAKQEIVEEIMKTWNCDKDAAERKLRDALDTVAPWTAIMSVVRHDFEWEAATEEEKKARESR